MSPANFCIRNMQAEFVGVFQAFLCVVVVFVLPRILSLCRYGTLQTGNCSLRQYATARCQRRLQSAVSVHSSGILMAPILRGAQESCVVTRAHRGSITILRSSPDGRYVASSGTDGALRVWLWSDLTPHMEFTSRGSSIPVPAWHPWQSSYLAVGSHCLAVYNVNNASLLAKQDFHLHHVTVYCMTWSHLTGELVVSLWVHEDVYSETEEHAEVLVLATANKVVDKLDVHSNVGKVIYLMWSPDGRKIATAGSDETLQVWTFIKDSSTVNKKRRQSEDFGYVIR